MNKITRRSFLKLVSITAPTLVLLTQVEQKPVAEAKEAVKKKPTVIHARKVTFSWQPLNTSFTANWNLTQTEIDYWKIRAENERP